MDLIKEAFSRIKEDINFLKKELEDIKKEINNIKTTPTYNPSLKTQQTNTPTHIQTTPTYNPSLKTQQTNTPTHIQTTPTYKHSIQGLYIENNAISTGNDGVPTNTPTNQQTHQQIENIPNSDFKKVNNILESLDNIKKEIRLKFKRLTNQEMLVFSTIYNLEDYNYEITYKIIAEELKLSESSIRDYINKLIKKGIPIDKKRKNNKTIILNISKDLKNIASLSTIQTLKDL